jgi:hypothetical protein
VEGTDGAALLEHLDRNYFPVLSMLPLQQWPPQSLRGSFGQPELGILEGAGRAGPRRWLCRWAMASLERFKPGNDLFSAKSLNWVASWPNTWASECSCTSATLAHEDDERAVRAGLELIAVSRSPSKPPDFPAIQPRRYRSPRG